MAYQPWIELKSLPREFASASPACFPVNDHQYLIIRLKPLHIQENYYIYDTLKDQLTDLIFYTMTDAWNPMGNDQIKCATDPDNQLIYNYYRHNQKLTVIDMKTNKMNVISDRILLHPPHMIVTGNDIHFLNGDDHAIFNVHTGQRSDCLSIGAGIFPAYQANLLRSKNCILIFNDEWVSMYDLESREWTKVCSAPSSEDVLGSTSVSTRDENFIIFFAVGDNERGINEDDRCQILVYDVDHMLFKKSRIKCPLYQNYPGATYKALTVSSITKMETVFFG